MTLVFGWAAAAISSIFRLPQLAQILITKRVRDLSFVSLICQFLVCPLYILHGCQIDDKPTILMGSLSAVQAGLILALYVKFKTQDGEDD